MLDFSRKDFNKAISLTDKKSVGIESKWSLVRVESILLKIDGDITKLPNKEIKEAGKYPVITQEKDKFISGYTNLDNPVTDLPLIVFGDHSCTFKYVNFPFVRGADGTQLLKVNPEKCLPKCFFYLIQLVEIINSDKYERHFKYLSDAKIPLPPKDIQQQIVSECEAIDTEVKTTEQVINNSRLEIENKIINLSTQGYIEKKLSEITHINPSKTELKGIDENTNISFIEMASVSNDGFIQHKEDRLLKDLKKGSYTYFRENDIIIAKITPCMENGKCALATGLTNDLAMGSSEFHVIRCDEKIISAKYIFSLLNRIKIRQEAERNMTGSSGHRRVPASFYEDYKIPIPDTEIQKNLVAQIEQLENKIIAAQKTINEAASKKQAVLKHYL